MVITAGDPEWLASFVHALVEERLCACGQVVAPIRSIYRWKGSVHDETEARVFLHTRVDLVPRVIERAVSDHPYDVPCVIAVPLVDGNSAYVDWVLAETVGEPV